MSQTETVSAIDQIRERLNNAELDAPRWQLESLIEAAARVIRAWPTSGLCEAVNEMDGCLTELGIDPHDPTFSEDEDENQEEQQ